MCTAAAALLFQTVGTIQQGMAQANAYKAQAKAMDQNAAYAKDQARDAIDRGGKEEHRLRERGRQFAASQKTGFAASGLDTGSGSALNILMDTATGVEEDAATIRTNAQREKYGFDVQATNYRNQANMARAAAKNTQIGTLFSAGATILNGSDVMPQKWQNWFSPMKTTNKYNLKDESLYSGWGV